MMFNDDLVQKENANDDSVNSLRIVWFDYLIK